MEKVDKEASLEFKWLKKRGVGGKEKDTQFYESFIYDGMKYVLYDCVYMYKEGLREPYIGKLTKIWEQENKAKKVKIHWFFRPKEISTWLGDIKPLENEIFFASGEGVGLANISPLEAIAGQCKVVCVSKDCRNPQPSDEELKAADFIFSRTFDVQSCTISDKMDEKVGGVEIKYIFNRRKEGENISTLPETTSDKKEENTKVNITRNEEENASKSLPNNGDIKLLMEVDVKGGESQDKGSKKVDTKDSEMVKVDIKTPAESDKLQDRPSKKIKSDDRKRSKNSKVKSKRLDDLDNRPLKKLKFDEKKEKEVEVAERLADMPLKESMVEVEVVQHAERLTTNMPSKKSKVEVEAAQDVERLTDVSSKKSLVEVEVVQGAEKLADMPSKESKVDNAINLPEASRTPATNEETPNQKKIKVDKGKTSSKASDKLEGRTLKKAKSDGTFKKPEDKKTSSVQKASVNMNGEDLIATGEAKLKSSENDNEEAKGEECGESKKKVSTSKLSSFSTDGDEKNAYQEFVVGPKPNADKSGWFRRLPWEERLTNAYDQGTAILLYNLDPDYTSEDVEDIIWHAFTENCEAKILPRTAVSSPHYCEALILLKTKEATQRILVKLDEECLMLSNGRPLVGIFCPPLSPKMNSQYFGHLAIDKSKFPNQRDMDEAVSTSHFSQPNTIEYDMAMEWCLLQTRSKKWWDKMHKNQGHELKKLKNKLAQK